MEKPRFFKGLDAISCFAAYPPGGFGFNEIPQRPPKQFVVVGDQNVDGVFHQTF